MTKNKPTNNETLFLHPGAWVLLLLAWARYPTGAQVFNFMMIHFASPDCYINTQFIARISFGNWVREDENNCYVDIETAGESGGIRILFKSDEDARKTIADLVQQMEKEQDQKPTDLFSVAVQIKDILSDIRSRT